MSFAFRGFGWNRRVFTHSLRFIRSKPHLARAARGAQHAAIGATLLEAFRYALRPSPPFTSNIDEPEIKLPRRLRRFHAFSSTEYNGVEYMTPRDFLDSIILDSPRERVFRRVITKGQLRSMLNATPPLRKGSVKMFRKLGDNGLISYAEYLFLITLLTTLKRTFLTRMCAKNEKLTDRHMCDFHHCIIYTAAINNKESQYAFNVAFLMFDEDENLQIDKKEFLIICSLIIAGHLSSKGDQYHEEFLQSCSIAEDLDISMLQYLTHHFSLVDYVDTNLRNIFSNLLEKLIFNSQKQYRGTGDTLPKSEQGAISVEKDVKDDNSPKDTTIMVHLFGRSGGGSLSLDQFRIFYHNLQREIIEIEFHEFARGKSEISSVDFARLVLRYSILHKNDHAHYIQRIYERSGFEEEGITLQQFEQFSMFLNNLEDFVKAVRLYTAADIPVSRLEFIRAVECSTGFKLDPHLVDVLYRIFDANGDDKLSYSEFIAIMSDRLHRGFRQSYAGHHATFGWMPFKKCMIHELSNF